MKTSPVWKKRKARARAKAEMEKVTKVIMVIKRVAKLLPQAVIRLMSEVKMIRKEAKRRKTSPLSRPTSRSSANGRAKSERRKLSTVSLGKTRLLQ
jgi:hypothetical protein